MIEVGTFGADDSNNGHSYVWLEHLNFNFTECYKVDLGADWDDKRPMQWFNELWFIEAGECEVVQDNKTSVAKAGDIVLLFAGLSRRTRSIGKTAITKIGLNYSLQIGAKFDVARTFGFPNVLNVGNSSLPKMLSELLEVTQKQDSGYFFTAPGLAQMCLGEAVKIASQGRELAENSPGSVSLAISSSLNEIAKNYHHNLHVSDLANVACLSNSRFASKFKEELGFSPNHYLRLYRMQKALELLQDKTLSIGEIAQRCGFDDQAYFSRSFKKTFGVCPRNYELSSIR